VRPITFDHGVAGGRDDVVLVHLNHRRVQMCLRLLRSWVGVISPTGGLSSPLWVNQSRNRWSEFR
jgi:hypothetical protein